MMRYADKIRQDYDWLYDKPSECRKGIEWSAEDERDFALYLTDPYYECDFDVVRGVKVA